MMKVDEILEKIEPLVHEGGFRSRSSLHSFCLAVGLFNEVKKESPGRVPASWDPSKMDIWPLLQIIAFEKDPTINDMEGMRKFLYPYLLGGAEMVSRKTDGKDRITALGDLADFLPVR